jgi:hypothetical protein
MNKDILEKYAEFVGEIDFLFQEGVYFSEEEKNNLLLYNEQLREIIESLNIK